MRKRVLLLVGFAIAVSWSGSFAQDPGTAADRLTRLERGLAALAERVANLERAVNVPAKKGEPVEKPRPAFSPIVVKLLAKEFVKGDFQEFLTFKFSFTSRLKKDVRAFSGTVVFKDLFGDVIQRISLKHTDGVAAGATATWSGSFEYNQFKDDDRTMRARKLSDLTVELELDQVIYKDGTREKFER